MNAFCYLYTIFPLFFSCGTIFYFLLLRWLGAFRSVWSRDLIATLHFHLIATHHSTMNHLFKTIWSQPFIWGVITVEVKCTQWTSWDTWQHLRRPVNIERRALHNASSSRTTWLYLNTPFLIGETQLKGIDSHSSVTSEPLIKDE